jgi:uncharacterized membrane protein
MHSLTDVVRMIAAIGVAAVVAIEPSFAGETPVAVPAPIVGAGIPALMAIGGSYWALRKRRKR